MAVIHPCSAPLPLRPLDLSEQKGWLWPRIPSCPWATQVWDRKGTCSPCLSPFLKGAATVRWVWVHSGQVHVGLGQPEQDTAA